MSGPSPSSTVRPEPVEALWHGPFDRLRANGEKGFGLSTASPSGLNTTSPFGLNTTPPFGLNTTSPSGLSPTPPFGLNTMPPFGLSLSKPRLMGRPQQPEGLGTQGKTPRRFGRQLPWLHEDGLPRINPCLTRI
jgi:hypothetical protein